MLALFPALTTGRSKMGMFNRPANLTDTSQASDAPQHGASDDTRFVSSKTERTSSGRVKAADAPRDSRSSELAPVSSLIVAVRTRPSVLALDPLRSSGRKDILRVMDARTVVVLDPDDSKLYLDKRVGRTKERRYVPGVSPNSADCLPPLRDYLLCTTGNSYQYWQLFKYITSALFAHTVHSHSPTQD